MLSYLTLAAGMLLLPIGYYIVIKLQLPFFEQEQNRARRPLSTLPEYVVMILSETALLRLWFVRGQSDFSDTLFLLLYIVLLGITILCMTDYWETVVPNKILLGMLTAFVLVVGVTAIRSVDAVFGLLPTIVLGFLFTLLSFGVGYLLSRGNIGAGDVKLAIVMGLMMTGEYVAGAIVYGCLAGAIYSVIMILSKRLTGKDKIPFVPFLYLGVIIRYWIG